MWRQRGKLRSRSTKVPHNGKFKDSNPVPPAAAKRELQKLENTLDAGRNYETRTLGMLLDMVEKEYRVAGYDSIGSLRSRLKHIRAWFGNIRADRITDGDLLDYAHDRQQGKDGKPGASNTTINREIEVVMKALRLGKIYPLLIFRKLTQPAPRQGFFNDEMIGAVIGHLPEYLKGPVRFGYCTGWRREEVFGLERRQVDLSAGEVRLWDSKTDQPRVFPVDVVPGLREILQSAMQREGNAITPYVFARKIKKTGQNRRVSDFRKAWQTACRKAGCPGMTFHDLRRSAARNLELDGWPRSMIMQWMGHETEAMFHRYRIVSAADREIVSKRLAKRESTLRR